MARNARKAGGKSNGSGERAGDPRRSRTIRFSDSEWQLVEDAALRQGIPASQLVRAVTLAAAEERLDRPTGAAITPGHLALIEATYRAVYVLATINRDEMLDAERGKELDEIVEEARTTMAETMDEVPA